MYEKLAFVKVRLPWNQAKSYHVPKVWGKLRKDECIGSVAYDPNKIVTMRGYFYGPKHMKKEIQEIISLSLNNEIAIESFNKLIKKRCLNFIPCGYEDMSGNLLFGNRY